MNISLSNSKLNAIDTHLVECVPPSHQQYYHQVSGKEHYRLLTHLGHCFNDIIISDIGTFRGTSALALAQNSRNRVKSFDIGNARENDIPLKNIEFCIGRFCADTVIQKSIIDSSLVLLDIYHDYNDEIWLYNFLVENGWRGTLLCDDIHLNEPMKRFWEEIKHPKLDLSKYGHITGTGCIMFDTEVNFTML